jgi:hypothetical protein
MAVLSRSNDCVPTNVIRCGKKKKEERLTIVIHRRKHGGSGDTSISEQGTAEAKALKEGEEERR